MTGIEHVDFGRRHVAAIGYRFRRLERPVVLAPEDEQLWLRLAHPGLPLGVGLDVRAIVVEEVALNVGLAGLVEKREFIGPEIRVVAIYVGIVPDVPCPRGRQREELGAKLAAVGCATRPTGTAR